MLNKFAATTLAILSVTVPFTVYANDDSCTVQVAVSSPPIQDNQRVAFNVTNDEGVSKSIILQSGSSYVIEKLNCTSTPYTISASIFSTNSNNIIKQSPPIGQCTLKAGYVVLNGPNNSVSVVFPYDFNCNF